MDQAKDVVANFVIDPNGPLAPRGGGVPEKKKKCENPQGLKADGCPPD